MKTRGPGVLREQNQKKVLSLLRQYKQTSRKDLAKAMGVSKNTISLIVDQYVKDGVINEVGVKDVNKAGRPKIVIELNQNAFKAIGIAIHHDGIEYMVTDFYLQPVTSGFCEVDGKDWEKVCGEILKIVESLLSEHPEVIGVGIGIPGIVNASEGIVYHSTNLGWKNIQVSDQLEKSIPVPIIIQNNVNLASLCSAGIMDESCTSSSFYIRIGDGIGGAFTAAGQIWNGDSWTSGEIGHISVDPNGPLCGCGQRGCLEKMISRKAFQEWLDQMEDKELPDGREQLQQQIKKYGIYLATSLINIIHLLNPGTIVIDSPYNQYGAFQESLLSHLEQNALKIPYSKTQIYFNNEPYSQSLGAATAVVLDFERE
ncbi:ROK family transcriptional regulator [Bacillus sp. HNG]|uniref:ROK family transcriptional regulator n=1 Tax=Bacillus sp. HNG TaxID=2293325 RepID=UPI000E2F4B35|nr:ROK family transcriptional regulator [Bacillus sp. HNG]RFB17375.1 ROK family transcriptional regulator [Bacillus sp. HNG]